MTIPHTRQHYNYTWHLHCSVCASQWAEVGVCKCYTISVWGTWALQIFVSNRFSDKKDTPGIYILFCRNTLHALIVVICSHFRSISFRGCLELMHAPLHFCCQCSRDNMGKERQHTRLHLMQTLPEKGNIRYAYFIHLKISRKAYFISF